MGARAPARGCSLLRDVALHLRSGANLREALSSAGATAGYERARAAAVLGLPLALVVRELSPILGGSGPAVAAAVSLHEEIGGDAASTFDELAHTVERAHQEAEVARANAAGAVASARMIAVLPIFGALTIPLAGTRPEALDLLFVVLAGTLGFAGFAWMRRLLPIPEPLHASDVLPTLVLAGVRSGCDLASIVRSFARAVGGPDLALIERSLRFGISPTGSLRFTSDERLSELGEALLTSDVLGGPLEGALTRVIEQRSGIRLRRAESLARRTPVRMILPLTLCIFPAFVLVSLGPFFRALLSPG